MYDGMGKKQSLEKDILKSSIVTMLVATDSYQQQLYHETQESFITYSLYHDYYVLNEELKI